MVYLIFFLLFAGLLGAMFALNLQVNQFESVFQKFTKSLETRFPSAFTFNQPEAVPPKRDAAAPGETNE